MEGDLGKDKFSSGSSKRKDSLKEGDDSLKKAESHVDKKPRLTTLTEAARTQDQKILDKANEELTSKEGITDKRGIQLVMLNRASSITESIGQSGKAEGSSKAKQELPEEEIHASRAIKSSIDNFRRKFLVSQRSIADRITEVRNAQNVAMTKSSLRGLKEAIEDAKKIAAEYRNALEEHQKVLREDRHSKAFQTAFNNLKDSDLEDLEKLLGQKQESVEKDIKFVNRKKNDQKFSQVNARTTMDWDTLASFGKYLLLSGEKVKNELG